MRTQHPLTKRPSAPADAFDRDSGGEICAEQQRKIHAAHQNAANAVLEHLRAISKHDRTLLNPFQRSTSECHKAWAQARHNTSHTSGEDPHTIASRRAAELMRIGRAPGINITFGNPATQSADLYPERHWTHHQWAQFLNRLLRPHRPSV